MMHGIGVVAGLTAYYALMVGSMLIIPLGIPGEFGIFLLTAAFTLIAGSAVMPWWVSIVLLVLCLFAEGVEALAGFFGAKRAKGSLRSAFGACAGGFVGAILGAPFGLVLGALAGAFIGTFAGAFIVEFLVTRSGGESSRAAVGATLGRVVGSVVKTAVACLMIVLVTVVLVAASAR